MLLNFKMKNFKSFYNTTELNMFADNNKREYQDRLINVKKGRLKKNVLPAMVISSYFFNLSFELITAFANDFIASDIEYLSVNLLYDFINFL